MKLYVCVTLLYTCLIAITSLTNSVSETQDDADSFYKVFSKSITSSYMIPEGCYGQKQLHDMLTLNRSKIKYKPQIPKWCSKREHLVPDYLQPLEPQISTPPYKISVYPFKNSDAYRVAIKSKDQYSLIQDAVLVARDVDLQGTIQTNSGRFLPARGVSLICCSYTDKDVGRFEAEKNAVPQAIFYWIPYEETIDDYEGDIIFIATVARNSEEYWINITSEIVNFTPPTFANNSLSTSPTTTHEPTTII